ncbi:MAG: MFS transporter [Halobacteriales archaeon]|nr:MFS transporter [Halobacteriales archaeon]
MAGGRPQLRPLYFTQFAGSLGFITLVTLLPTYIDLLDPSGTLIGLFVTSLALARAAAIVPIGWAGDRYDKRTVLLAALAVSAVSYAAFAFVSTSAGFVGARLLQGLGIAGTGLLALALVGEIAPTGERANAIGKYNAWRMAAGIIGTLGAGALYQLSGFAAVFGLLAALLAAAFVAVYRRVEPDETSIEGFAFTALALNRRLLTVTSFRIQYAVAVTLVRNWVPIYVGVSAARGGLGQAAVVVGAVVAAEKFANMLGQPRAGRLSDRFGRARFVLLGGGVYGLVALLVPFAPAIGTALGLPGELFGYALAPGFFVLVALNGLLGAADSVREPASMALFADEGAGSGIASSFGVRNLVWLPGSIVAPMVGGYLMTQVGMEWVFYLGGAAALSGVATMLAVLVRRHGRGALGQW